MPSEAAAKQLKENLNNNSKTGTIANFAEK